VDDNPRDADKLLALLFVAICFIRKALAEQRNVLVHCFAGKSRSVTIIMAYLMTREIEPVQEVREALRLVAQVRPKAAPNLAFTIMLKVRLEASSRPCCLYLYFL